MTLPITPPNLFFDLTLHLARPDWNDGGGGLRDGDTSSGEQPPSLATPWTLGPFERAMDRIQALVGSLLTPEMSAALQSLLSVLHIHISPLVPHSLILRIASGDLPDDSLRDMANTICAGLLVFAALGGRLGSTTEPSLPLTPSDASPSTPGMGSPSLPLEARKPKSKSSSRSQRVRRLCEARDCNTCQLTKRTSGAIVSHILPFSMRNEKEISFWKFVALFRGEEETVALRDAVGMGAGMGTDSLLNVWMLTEDAHGFFDKGWVSLLPQITDAQMPYDPNMVDEYSAIVEFPYGSYKALIGVASYNARGRPLGMRMLEPGETIHFVTSNPSTNPLPHPLLFQLHAIISRIAALKASAGFPLLTNYDWETDSQDGAVGNQDLQYRWFQDHGGTTPLHISTQYDNEMKDDHRSSRLKPSHVSPQLSAAYTDSNHKSQHIDGYLQEHPRVVKVIQAEYQLRMDEMWEKMVVRLGERKEGVKWWREAGPLP